MNNLFEKRARDEIDKVIGSKIDISIDDLNKLEYVSCVFKEALRKWPPGAEFSRMTKKDITLYNGLKIPKDTWVEVGCSFTFKSILKKIHLSKYQIRKKLNIK